MKRFFTLILVTTIATSAVAATRSRYVVATKTHPAASRVRILSDDSEFRLHDVRAFAYVNAFAADLTDDEAAQLRQNADVRYLHKVVERHLLDAAPAPRFTAAPAASPLSDGQQTPYGIGMVHATAVWPFTRGAGPVNVAILDTGLDRTHPDLAQNVAGGYNVLTQTGNFADDNGHGTHVAGTIAAVDNGIGVVGVAPQAHVWSVKVLDSEGNGTDENVIAGIDKVLEWKHTKGGRWIVSLSLGAPDSSDTEKAAFQQLADEDILAVAAAGNRGLPALEYPGGYPTVLAVGAVSSDGSLASFSSYGTGLAVVAPGVKVLSTVPVGSAVTSSARLDGQPWITAYAVTAAPHRELHAPFVDCGLGRPEDFPANVKGKIALMKRGELYFAEKVRNAVDAGAVGAIIYNKDSSVPSGFSLIRLDCVDPTLGPCNPWQPDVDYPWPVTVAVTQADGEALLAHAGESITIGTWDDDYKMLDGTSMATPHVSGVAALLLSLNPAAHADDVRTAIVSTAHDLGPAGWDQQYGFGLIDAAAAAKLIAPGSVIISPAPPPATPPPSPPPSTPPPPPRRRVVH